MAGKSADDVAEGLSVLSFESVSEFRTEDEEMVVDDVPFVPRRKLKTQPKVFFFPEILIELIDLNSI